MKRLALALSMAGLAAGCAVPARNMDRVQAGMSQDQVQSIMGQPIAVSHSPGKECAYYELLKDFWSRVPWSALRAAITSATTTARSNPSARSGRQRSG